MNMQTEGNSSLDLEAQNYTVGAFQRQVGSSSNIAGIFVNRQGFSNDKIDYSSFNRIVGLDFNLASEDSKYRGSYFIIIHLLQAVMTILCLLVHVQYKEYSNALES